MFKALYHVFSRFLSRRNIHIIKSLRYLSREKIIPLERFDYVRIASLELTAHELKQKNIQGSVAELGVYQGEFAKDINSVFPDKKLYLFDTFEGFDNRDVKTEVTHKYSTGDQNFSDTSVDLVLSKMPYPENCQICKGFFPATTEGLNDKFCFVSIDTDLYQPILEGLRYFYPRLTEGGYIFVHDFNNDEYKGAREAVTEFCRENAISYFPIADIGGTAVIMK